MTIEDLLAREGIRHALHSYNMAGDRVRSDEVAAVFTEDGILESDGMEANAFRYVGSKAIRDFMESFRIGPKGGSGSSAGAAGPRPFVRHNLTTCQIELTGPDTAKARTYFMVITQIGPDHSGIYIDTLRKVGERWLIAHRKVRIDWKSSASTAGSQLAKQAG